MFIIIIIIYLLLLLWAKCNQEFGKPEPLSKTDYRIKGYLNNFFLNVASQNK